MERLLSAALWGTGLALAVALLCRCFPKAPASVRFWLWWAVPAKLLLGLLTPVSLAVLPASQRVPAHPETRPATLFAAPTRSQSDSGASSAAPTRLQGAPLRSPRALVSSPRVRVLSSELLALLWLTGALLALLRAVSGPARVYIALRTYRSDSAVWEIPGMGPLVFGLVRPVIVLPTGLSDSEKRLALAHERAHLVRRDPWLALVPLAARVVFWFLPTVYLVERALATAREEACDALARRSTGASAREYGALLLKLTQPSPGLPGSLAMASPAYAQLQSRLQSLRLPPTSVPGWPLLLPGALLLPGWHLAERTSAPLKKPTARLVGYQRQDLPTLGGRYSDAFALTKDGQVVGSANGRDGAGRAVLWQAGVPQVLERGRSIAYAISATGEVALSTLQAGKRSRAHWLRSGARQSLPGLPGFPESCAVGLTEAGTLVGSVRSRDGSQTRAVCWEAGRVRDLGTLGGPCSQAAAVNASGWVVGKADVSPTETHAFLFDGKTLRDLGTLGGRHSRALAINATGLVVGVSETPQGARQAFVWSEQTGMRALGGAEGAALAIADDGTVAGQADGHAALWQPDGTPIALDPSLVVVRGINPRGELVGQGWVGADLRGFLLKPVFAASR
jgi:probable HAF family extracellular repeat protein